MSKDNLNFRKKHDAAKVAGAVPMLPRKLGPGDDLQMINSPELWPWETFLPVKNRDQVCPITGIKPKTGIILASDTTTVLIGLMGLTKFNDPNCQKEYYASVQALLDAGWIVD